MSLNDQYSKETPRESDNFNTQSNQDSFRGLYKNPTPSFKHHQYESKESIIDTVGNTEDDEDYGNENECISLNISRSETNINKSLLA